MNFRRYWRERWRAMAAKNVAAGKNTRGGERKRRPRLSVEDRRAYNLQKFHLRADRLAAAGKTTRGGDRKQRISATKRSSVEGKIRTAVVNCERIKAEATMRALNAAAAMRLT